MKQKMSLHFLVALHLYFNKMKSFCSFIYFFKSYSSLKLSKFYMSHNLASIEKKNFILFYNRVLISTGHSKKFLSTLRVDFYMNRAMKIWRPCS